MLNFLSFFMYLFFSLFEESNNLLVSCFWENDVGASDTHLQTVLSGETGKLL